MAAPAPNPYVSRGGLKLEHALARFGVRVEGITAADLGCSTGGFTDCLLRHGAARVYSVDTAYGELAWKLRNDPRVSVLERTNALHAEPAAPVRLVVADLGWTPQRLLVPAAMRWLGPGGRIITLIKPHYELSDRDRGALPRGGVLDEATSRRVAEEVLASMPTLGVRVVASDRSPIAGGAGGGGNTEWLALLEPA
jgi:23S rRNA (cytidine1920-2'-O)/16S rRNA (cytidine1409-2'-O)-methyltransferase